MELTVRRCTTEDHEEVCALDEKSGYNVQEWLDYLDEFEESNFIFGIFEEQKMVGYCTIRNAKDCSEYIIHHPDHNKNSLFLSDVYVLPEYQNSGVGKTLVSEAIQIKQELEPESKNIYLTVVSDDLDKFYKELGFEWVDQQKAHAMVRALDYSKDHFADICDKELPEKAAEEEDRDYE